MPPIETSESLSRKDRLFAFIKALDGRLIDVLTFSILDSSSLHALKMATYKLQINGRGYQADVDPDTPLLWVLRDHFGLVGTKYGCGIAQCGACTVHLNGEAARACVLPVSAVGKSKVTTIEGLSATGNHPVQQAWDKIDVPQCGYCQAGQIMTAAALLKRNPKPSQAEIDDTMTGNLCRCGTYHRIREAVKLASMSTTPTGATKSSKTK